MGFRFYLLLLRLEQGLVLRMIDVLVVVWMVVQGLIRLIRTIEKLQLVCLPVLTDVNIVIINTCSRLPCFFSFFQQSFLFLNLFRHIYFERQHLESPSPHEACLQHLLHCHYYHTSYHHVSIQYHHY